MLGSLALESDLAYLTHLSSMAKCLKQGGLHLIDGVPCTTWPEFGKEEWAIKKNGLTIEVKWEETPLDLKNQMIREIITLKIKEKEKSRDLREEITFKFLLLTEFSKIITKNRKFEFIGRFNNFDLNQPLKQATKINRPITILRRK